MQASKSIAHVMRDVPAHSQHWLLVSMPHKCIMHTQQARNCALKLESIVLLSGQRRGLGIPTILGYS